VATILTAPNAPILCGKIGGTIFQRWGWGTRQRSRRYSVSYPSEQAQRRLSAMHALAALWAYRLTNDQRLSWGSYANTHPVPSPCTGVRYLTAMNWFIKLNMSRYLAGDPLLLFAP
jgi:hypothetical protein